VAGTRGKGQRLTLPLGSPGLPCPANMLVWTAMIQPAFRFPSG
jgi:hypothetical protein